MTSECVQRVSELREAEGLTQQAFAEKYGLSVGRLRDWEQGRTEPDDAWLYLYASLQRLTAENAELRAENPIRVEALRALGDLVSRVDAIDKDAVLNPHVGLVTGGIKFFTNAVHWLARSDELGQENKKLRAALATATDWNEKTGVGCPLCRHEGDQWIEPCGLHKQIHEMSEDALLHRQIMNSDRSMLDALGDIIGFAFDDDPLQVARSRMEEIEALDEELGTARRDAIEEEASDRCERAGLAAKDALVECMDQRDAALARVKELEALIEGMVRAGVRKAGELSAEAMRERCAAKAEENGHTNGKSVAAQIRWLSVLAGKDDADANARAKVLADAHRRERDDD